jgi:hypothetical protein
LTWASAHREDAPAFLSAQGAQVLNCPGCSTKVADGTSICPSCDYIIDSSFLSADVPDDLNDETDEQTATATMAPPPRPPARGTPAQGSGVRIGQGGRPARARPAPSAPRSAPPPPVSASHPAAGTRRPANFKPSFDDELPDEPTATSGLPPRSQIVDPEDLVQDARQFVRNLGQSDKIAVGGAATLLISGFLPWKETAADGEILGMMSLGVVAMLAAIGLITLIAFRKRREQADPYTNVLLYWMGQLVVSIFCIFWCIIYMKVSSDSRLVPTAMGDAVVQNSAPVLGVYLGLLGALGSLGGTLLGMKERPE